ncbi:hypothetical protein J6590_061155 [Homalodisca vitripennis]|nr:hypothetical protein J6590_061155 [Homalodisca vitripennis]
MKITSYCLAAAWERMSVSANRIPPCDQTVGTLHSMLPLICQDIGEQRLTMSHRFDIPHQEHCPGITTDEMFHSAIEIYFQDLLLNAAKEGILSKNNLSEKQKKKLDILINRSFSVENDQGVGRTDLVMHSTDTGKAKPIKQRYYTMSPARMMLVEQELDRMLE